MISSSNAMDLALCTVRNRDGAWAQRYNTVYMDYAQLDALAHQMADAMSAATSRKDAIDGAVAALKDAEHRRWGNFP